MSTVRCDAGLNHFLLYPNGDVYACMADYNAGEPPLGNALDPSSFPRRPGDLRACPHRSCYAACDLDWATRFEENPDGVSELTLGREIKDRSVLGPAQWRDERGQWQAPARRFAHVLWAPSLVCNYTCAYCGCAAGVFRVKRAFRSSEPELTLEQWLGVWDRMLEAIDYGIVDLSGGEPLLYRVIVPLLERISSKMLVGLTTNMSQQVYALSRARDLQVRHEQRPGFGLVPLGVDVTASLHPTSKHFRAELFKGSVLLLKNSGFGINVNLVGYPLQLYLADEWKAWCHTHGIDFTLSPWCGTTNDGERANYLDHEMAYLNRVTTNKRQVEDTSYNQGDPLIRLDELHYVEPRGLDLHFAGRVENTSRRDFEPGYRVGMRLYAIDDRELCVGEFRSPSDITDLRQGSSASFCLNVPTNKLGPGHYRAVLDVVNEGRFWMADWGHRATEVSVRLL